MWGGQDKQDDILSQNSTGCRDAKLGGRGRHGRCCVLGLWVVAAGGRVRGVYVGA